MKTTLSSKDSKIDISKLRPNFPPKGVSLSFAIDDKTYSNRKHLNRWKWEYDDGTLPIRSEADVFRRNFLQLPDEIKRAAMQRVFKEYEYATPKQLYILGLCFFKPFSAYLINLSRKGSILRNKENLQEQQERELLRLVEG